MYFYPRAYINEALRLATRQSYRVVHATASGRIRSDSVLALLNQSRVGIKSPCTTLPSDLLTPDEACQVFGVSQRELRRWSKRSRNPTPHYTINSWCVRYPKGMLEDWLKENS